MTTDFRRVSRRHARDQEDTATVLGDILRRGHALVGSLYGAWTSGHLRISRWTASRYVAVARLAEDDPAAYRGWRGVGLSRLCMLSRVPATVRHRLVNRRNLGTMRTTQFIALVRRVSGLARRVTMNQRAHGLCTRLRALRRRMQDETLGHITSPGLRRRLEQELRATAVMVLRVRNEIRTAVRRARPA